MYVHDLPTILKDADKVLVRCDSCGKEKEMAWVNARRNAEKYEGKHILRCCLMKGKNNPACRPEVRDKMKQTSLERYGVTCPLNQAEKVVERIEKMFGTEIAKQKIVEKRKRTSRERYGADHIMQTQEGIDRLKTSMQERYGVDFPLQNADVMQKTRQTNLERYGVTNVGKAAEVRIKIARTTLERYGVEHYNQLPEMKDYLRENCKEWLAESYAAGGPNKGIVRPEEWNRKQSETVSRLIGDGTWRGGGKHSKKGRYIGSNKCRKSAPIFRSSYEQIVHLHLDADEAVEWYDYEPFVIPYRDTENAQRSYTPDFLVKYKGSSRLKLIEVKNDFTINAGININKNAATVIYSEANGIDYEVWTNTKIASLNIKITEHESKFEYFGEDK